MGLPVGWRGAKHARAIGGRDSNFPFKMSAVRRHPLWTAAHVDAPVTDISPYVAFIFSCCPRGSLWNVTPSQPWRMNVPENIYHVHAN